MQKSDRKRRRERLYRNFGFLLNFRNLSDGFFFGVASFVLKPIQGVKKEGFEGLIKGVGHGVVGLFAQLTTGVFDFASTANHFQKSVSVNEETKRQRLIRLIHSDGILRSFSSYEADGRQMLKNLNSSSLDNDIYLNHFLIEKDRFFIITNKSLLLIQNDSENSCFLTWCLENINVSRIDLKDKSLSILLKVGILYKNLLFFRLNFNKFFFILI